MPEQDKGRGQPLHHRVRQLRRRLRQREAQLRQIIDLAPFLIFVKDWEGRFRLVNEAMAEALGTTVRSLTGRRHEEVLPAGEPSERMLAEDFEVLASGETKVVPERAFEDAAGRRRILRTTKIPFASQIDGARAVLGIVEDITERRLAERRFQRAVERSPCGMMMTDAEGRILLVNGEMAEIVGYGRDELLGKPAGMLVPRRFRDQHAEAWRGLIADPEGVLIRSQDAYALRKDGTEVAVEVGMNPIDSRDGLLVLSYVVDITDRKRAEDEVRALNAEMEGRVVRRTAQLAAANEKLEQEIAERRKAEAQLQRARKTLELANQELQHLALKDALTGLANRRHFDQCLDHEWRRAQRTGKPLALVLIDIDHFKQFNDERGHQAGDSCIRRVGQALARALHRPADLVARYGGEEFAVLLPETGRDGARTVAQNMRSRVAALNIPHPKGGAVTISLGVCSVRVGKVGGPADLVALADEALYRAKDAGRNAVRSAPTRSVQRPAGGVGEAAGDNSESAEEPESS